MGQYDIPRWREGGVTAQVMAIFIGDDHLHRPLERALDMVAAFHREIEANPDTLLLATTADDVRRAKAEGKTALLLSFEGGEPLGRDLNLLEIFYRLGLRMISLTHSRRNFLADGTQLSTQTGGLTHLGRDLVRRMNELGMVIDLAHLSDAGVWEILELSKDPVIYSHTTVAEMPGYKTGLTDPDPNKETTKLKALAAQGGVACAIFVAQPDVEAVVDDIDAMIQHVGDDHVGLGSDFVSLAHAPKGLEDISRLPAVTEAMVRRGFSDETILKVLGGNLLRVFEQVFR
jgi:membrane dipeptidase